MIMNQDLLQIVTEVDRLIPQLTDFISQFKTVVLDTGITVVSDTYGNMSIDVPMSMSEKNAETISTRINVLDRLINNHGSNINSLLQQGLSIEQYIKKSDPSYNSQLIVQVAKFKALNASYSH